MGPEPEDAEEQSAVLSAAREQIASLRETEKQLTKLIGDLQPESRPLTKLTRDLQTEGRPSTAYLLILLFAIIAFIIWVTLTLILLLVDPNVFTFEARIDLSRALWISQFLTIGFVLFAMALKWR